MKILFLLLSLVGGLGGVPTGGLSLIDKVQINELLINPEGSDAEGEWIELRNLTGQELDLSGAMLIDESDNKYVLDESIAAAGYLVIERKKSGISLNNDADSLSLYDGQGQLVDQAEYEDNVAEGFGLVNDINLGWVVSDQLTRGESNTELLDEIVPGEESSSAYQLVDSLSQVSGLSVGSLVTVRGVVAVGFGQLEVNKLWVQDEGGGLAVKLAVDPGYRVGDRIEISGRVEELTYRMIVAAEKSELVVAKQGLLTEKITAEKLTGYKDRLVKLTGAYVSKDSSSFMLEDDTGEVRVYLKDQTGLEMPELTKGQTVEVIGLVDQIKSGYRLLPRLEEDIILLASDGKVLPKTLPSTGFDWTGLWTLIYQKIINLF